ncbi:MAG TPA: tRNA (adenosine(37)-N6)-threonylcarbamoyltransferase complex dimerization subunit type 1 TsaB [Candidatus Dependentiae bacterium]|nr:tRNA (adenosine(37)-N6)-threonylcarbamoyltransferase complex dimerization subunit type 1 TsaB [Candidatus Dependentiae bacterium]HRQ62851.1 tRNA (adenosine(37)-N6)-threonylcarbamoyltransferase complex dimerization subunit type 1 TsaB [Candidatus Dependentiae bacterium]
MQKSKLTSNLFLAIQNTYESIELGLFEQDRLIDVICEPKIHASKNFIPCIQQLLACNNIALDAIQFLAVNQGPGPFTTLRVVLASTNGLSFAQQIPMTGIDGLHALVEEHLNDTYPNTIVLLNAFNQEVYFAIHIHLQTIETGYMKITELLKQIHNDYPNDFLRFIGNGTALYRDDILHMFGNNAYIPEHLPQTCSLKQIGTIGWQQWQQKKNISYQLLPLYLKKHAAQQAFEQK